VKLNPAAGEILSRCDGGRTVSEIVAELSDKFPEADNLRNDVFNFLSTAHENQWIQRNPA